MGVMQDPLHLCRGREREKYEDGISKEKTYPVSQKPNEERISRRRSTEKNYSEKHSKMRTKKKYINLTKKKLLLNFFRFV